MVLFVAASHRWTSYVASEDFERLASRHEAPRACAAEGQDERQAHNDQRWAKFNMKEGPHGPEAVTLELPRTSAVDSRGLVKALLAK